MAFGRRVIETVYTVGRVSESVLTTEELARRAARGASDVARGSAGVYRVGVAGRHQRAGGRHTQVQHELIGADFYHSDGDREAALALIDAAFAAFRADVEPRATTIDASPARAQWWRADAMPYLSDWSEFRKHQSSWVNRIATEWSTYEAWLVVLRGMRSGARAQGLVLASPEPGRLSQTMFERGESGRGSKIEAAWTIGKVLLYTAVGVVGTASLYTVWRDLQASKEPSEP